MPTSKKSTAKKVEKPEVVETNGDKPEHSEFVEAAVQASKEIDPQVLAQTVAALEARNRPTLAEPTEEELEFGDDITFVRTGLIRCRVAGQSHILRRPSLGELHDLETAKASTVDDLKGFNEELNEKNKELLDRAREVEEEAKDLDPSSARKAELDVEATNLTLAAIRAREAFQRQADDLREVWWKQVFGTLTPPGHKPPEVMPSWAGDANLPDQVITLWRTSPLAYGNR